MDANAHDDRRADQSCIYPDRQLVVLGPALLELAALHRCHEEKERHGIAENDSGNDGPELPDGHAVQCMAR